MKKSVLQRLLIRSKKRSRREVKWREARRSVEEWKAKWRMKKGRTKWKMEKRRTNRQMKKRRITTLLGRITLCPQRSLRHRLSRKRRDENRRVAIDIMIWSIFLFLLQV